MAHTDDQEPTAAETAATGETDHNESTIDGAGAEPDAAMEEPSIDQTAVRQPSVAPIPILSTVPADALAPLVNDPVDADGSDADAGDAGDAEASDADAGDAEASDADAGEPDTNDADSGAGADGEPSESVALPVAEDPNPVTPDAQPTEVMAAIPAADDTHIMPPIGLPAIAADPVRPEQVAAGVAAQNKPTKTSATKAKKSKQATQPGKKRWSKGVLGFALTLVVAGGAYAGAQWFVSDKVARGTTVEGVEIGGLSTKDALAKLDQTLGGRVGEPMKFTAGELSTELVPADSGVSFSSTETIANLTDFTWEPVTLWTHITGGSAIEPVVTVDQPKMDAALTSLASSLLTDPVDGTVGFEGTKAVTTPAIDGIKVEPEPTQALILASLFATSRDLAAPVSPIEPAINQAITDAAFAQAQAIASAPVVVQVGEQKAEIPVSDIIELTTFSTDPGAVTANFDGKKLETEVLDRTTDLLSTAKNAYFTFEGGKPFINAGKKGTTLDPEALSKAFADAALSTDRVAKVSLVESNPERGVAELEALGVKELVASFSTPITNEPVRTKNLRNAANKITGYLVLPGKEFDLLKVVGPVTAANGYFNAGVVVNGVHTDGMGGGLSQVATTTYNAGFFAGMADVAHRPHSYHFTRYPAGREATVFVGSIDMIWRNDSPHGVLMRSYVANGQYTVEAWSTKTYEVTTSSSGKYNVVPAKVTNSTAANCAPYPRGNPGFGITIYRKVKEIATGKVVIDEKNSWTYRPDNGITCNKPEPKPDAKDTAKD